MLSLAGVTSEESGSFRLDTWRDTLRMSTASPLLGQGLGAFADAYPRYKRGHGVLRVEHAGNGYLEMLADGGAAGLGLSLLVMALPVRVALRAREKRSSRFLRALVSGVLSGIAALLVHSAFDFNLRVPSNALTFSFMFAVSMGAVGVSRSPRSHGAALALLGACLLIVVARTPATVAITGR